MTNHEDLHYVITASLSLDDNAFEYVLYEFQHGTISYDADHLETLFFNPILDQHSTLSDPNSDLDPDLNSQNYASSASYCNYETAEDLNGVIGGNNLISFSLFHLNARHRANKIGGRVGLFIDQNFSYKILTEFNVSDANIIESLFVEVCIPRHKNIITGVIYRPPSENTLEFVEKLNEIISGVTKGNKHCYITGDFNLDLLEHAYESEFIESLFAFSFLPMITKPTRITAHSATLTDNIFTNNTTVSSKNGLIISDISDHLLIFSIVFGDYLRKDSNSFTIRDTSEK